MQEKPFAFQKSVLHHGDCLVWLKVRPQRSIHAVVTDPPYGLYEYTDEQQTKLRNGKGGVWRIPPSFDGNARSPLPRFTTLDNRQLAEIGDFFSAWASALMPTLVPGANVIVASNPLGVPYSRNGPGPSRTGTARRSNPADYDHAGRRPSQGGARGIQRGQRDAPVNVGAVAGLSQAAGRARSGQLAKVENRRFPPPQPGQAFRRRDSLRAHQSAGKGTGAPIPASNRRRSCAR